MWLVSKGSNGLRERTRIAPALAATLRIWYQGSGCEADEAAPLMLVRHARNNGQWIACDCQGEERAPPLLSPGLLAEAETFYLRRLTGDARTEHQADCPFFREQSLPGVKSDRLPPRNPPEGYFSILRPAPDALAQVPDLTDLVRDNASHGTPRLAKLLWRLLDVANRNVMPPRDADEPSIAHEFAAIKRVAHHLEIAPGLSLGSMLFTQPRDWETNRLFAILRDQAKRWPHMPVATMRAVPPFARTASRK
jgi:hypothetical protein